MSNTATLLHRDWECAKGCGSSARTYDDALPHHPCKYAGGLMIALIPAGTKAGVKIHERGDYVGKDIVTMVEGIPVMSTTVEHDDGYDTTVYVPCATATVERGSLARSK